MGCFLRGFCVIFGCYLLFLFLLLYITFLMASKKGAIHI
jgi:hypothetical protein